MLSHGSTKSQMSRMQDDLDRLRRQMAVYSEHLGESASEAGRHGLAGLRDAYDRAQVNARVYGDTARRQAEEATGKAREQVKAHPLSTVAGAFAVGVVLGALLGRR